MFLIRKERIDFAALNHEVDTVHCRDGRDKRRLESKAEEFLLQEERQDGCLRSRGLIAQVDQVVRNDASILRLVRIEHVVGVGLRRVDLGILRLSTDSSGERIARLRNKVGAGRKNAVDGRIPRSIALLGSRLRRRQARKRNDARRVDTTGSGQDTTERLEVTTNLLELD